MGRKLCQCGAKTVAGQFLGFAGYNIFHLIITPSNLITKRSISLKTIHQLPNYALHHTM